MEFIENVNIILDIFILDPVFLMDKIAYVIFFKLCRDHLLHSLVIKTGMPPLSGLSCGLPDFFYVNSQMPQLLVESVTQVVGQHGF